MWNPFFLSLNKSGVILFCSIPEALHSATQWHTLKSLLTGMRSCPGAEHTHGVTCWYYKIIPLPVYPWPGRKHEHENKHAQCWHSSRQSPRSGGFLYSVNVPGDPGTLAWNKHNLSSGDAFKISMPLGMYILLTSIKKVDPPMKLKFNSLCKIKKKGW